MTFTLRLNAAGDALDSDANHVCVNALAPAPTAMSYPATNRRVPAARVEQTRAWGRKADATTRPALVLEWQPRVERAGTEIIRGGDGSLKLTTLTIDGARASDGGATASTGPDADLPTFRVIGTTASHAQMIALCNALVEAEHAAGVTASTASITALSLECWQNTIREVFLHEAGVQFDRRATAIRRYAGLWYGNERDMPIFGPPHGYGFGQMDNPPITDDSCWSFLENLKACVQLLMRSKASGSWSALHAHFSTPLTRRDKAVHRRETVRRYNGGREFRWNATASAFEINPTVEKWKNPSNHAEGPNGNLSYPNNTLGTGVVYFTGTGAATLFPWPIAFAEADFGPDI
jgi:hypothetical protein